MSSPRPLRLAELDPSEQARLLSRASHDLRAHLNAVLGFAGTLLLRLPGPLTADQDEQVRAIRGSAQDLLRLIDRLTHLAQLETGQLRATRDRVDVAALLDLVAARHRGAAGARLVVQGSGALETEARTLQSALDELVDNAVRFGGAGEVRLERVPAAPGKVAFSVRDNGPGMTAEDAERLFRPFAPLGSRATREHEGPGVGLYLAARLAERLGGELKVECAPGAGCNFLLTVPER